MTVLSPDEKEEFKDFLDELTLDAVYTPIKLLVVRAKLNDPNYRVSQNTEKIYPTFQDFNCRIYHLLSSKLNRIFRSATTDIIADFGKIDETIWIVEYTMGRYQLLSGSGIADNLAPSATSLIDNGADFISQGVRVGAKVKNLTDNSEGYVTALTKTTLTFLSLDGGTANEIANLDQYEVYNLNYLLEDDQVYIPQVKHWCTALNTIPDSEGLQVATFVKDV